MADSVSTEAWLDQRRWAALEEALKAQGSNVKRHLQDYLITLYNETVPLERWVQIETAITKEELESAQEAEDQKVYAAFHIRENGHDSIFSTANGEGISGCGHTAAPLSARRRRGGEGRFLPPLL